MTKTRLFIGFLFAVLASGAGGWHWWMTARFVETTDDAYVQSDISVIAPKVEGYVRRLEATDNQQVRAGDVLLAIDDRDFRAKVDQAQAALDAQLANLGTIDSQITLQAVLIAEAEAEIASAEAELRRARQDLDRYRNLARGDFASRQRLETAEADSRKAEAATRKRYAARTAARNQVAVLEAQRQESSAKIAQFRAQLALAASDLENTTIRAPVTGVVGNKAVQLGQYVKAGTPLLSIVPLPSIYIVANFKETQVGRIRPGQKVALSVDAFSDRPIDGTVESVAPGTGAQFSVLPPENATGNFTKIVQRLPVRITVPTDNPLAGALRPGLSVFVSIDTRDEGQQRSFVPGGLLGSTAEAAMPASMTEPR